MKFAQKLTLSALVLLSALLAFTGAQLVRRNFQTGLEVQLQSAEHAQARRARQAETLLWEQEDAHQAIWRFSEEAGTAGTPMFAVYEGGNVAASRLPAALPILERDAAAAQPGVPRLCRAADGAHYLLTATRLARPGRDMVLLSAYELEPLFRARTGQLGTLAATSALTLALAGLLLLFWAQRLTRPLAQLDEAAHRMAAGDYAQRVTLRTQDEVGRLAQSFNAMGEAVAENVGALQREVRRREDFVSAFTHELKTPLTSMMGYAALLRQQDQPPQTVHEASEFIYRETKRLETLSGNLLALLGLGEAPAALRPVSLDKVFEAVRRRLPAQGAAVQFFPSGLTVRAEQTLLETLVENLVSNARKACREKGSATVRAEKAAGACLLTVADTGCGIPAKELSRVTEPFYMVDKSRARAENGSGMGLALCVRIAQAHGGALELTSREGEGTTATVRLALAEEEDDP